MKTLLQNAKTWIPLPTTGLNFTSLYPWILWYLWKARNLLLFEKQISSPADCINIAISEALSCQAAQGFSRPSRSPAPQLITRLLSPQALGFFACFSDAAWSKNSLFCGVRWILRNPAGEDLASSSKRLSYVPSDLCGEAFALRSALLVAQEAQISSIVCYSDC